MNFLGFRDSTNQYFYNDKIIKFKDSIQTNQILIGHQFNRNSLPKEILELFVKKSDIHIYETRSLVKNSLHLPLTQSTHYGILSLRYMVPYTYNLFTRVHPELKELSSISSVKKWIMNIHLDNYKTNF